MTTLSLRFTRGHITADRDAVVTRPERSAPCPQPEPPPEETPMTDHIARGKHAGGVQPIALHVTEAGTVVTA